MKWHRSQVRSVERRSATESGAHRSEGSKKMTYTMAADTTDGPPATNAPRPEVEGPNSYPTNGRFDTSTDSYAAGWPPTPTVTESAERARRKIQGD
jgi:hypothetical protein